MTIVVVLHATHHGKIAVLVIGLLKTLVQPALNPLPDGISVRLDHHGATHRAIVCMPTHVVVTAKARESALCDAESAT